MTSLITRFAPSPTGYLHLGHVISMAFVWGIATAKGAKILLRLEDHDRERCRPEYEQAILDDMAWLGFIPDNWEEFTLKKKTSFRQSDCLDLYETTLQQLQHAGKVYFCQCSRKQLVDEENGELYYPGWCRHKKIVGDNNCGVRFVLANTAEEFHDLRHGPLIQQPDRQCGDFLLKDRRGNFTYNFSVVIDDLRHGVNLIVRGDDLLGCTGRQIALARALGSDTTPFYFHHPLVVDKDGNKLSKRTLAEGIICRRERGDMPENVIGDALYLAGILDKPRPISVDAIHKKIQEFAFIY